MLYNLYTKVLSVVLYRTEHKGEFFNHPLRSSDMNPAIIDVRLLHVCQVLYGTLSCTYWYWKLNFDLII